MNNNVLPANISAVMTGDHNLGSAENLTPMVFGPGGQMMGAGPAMGVMTPEMINPYGYGGGPMSAPIPMYGGNVPVFVAPPGVMGGGFVNGGPSSAGSVRRG